jgi:hypothetical protein
MASRIGWRRRHRPRHRRRRFRSCTPLPSGRSSVSYPLRMSSDSGRRGKSASWGNPKYRGTRRSGGAQGRNAEARQPYIARRSRKQHSFQDQRCNNARRPSDSRRPRRTRRLLSPLHCRPRCLRLPRSQSHLLPPGPSQPPLQPRGSIPRLLPSYRAPPRRRNRSERYMPPRWQRGSQPGWFPVRSSRISWSRRGGRQRSRFSPRKPVWKTREVAVRRRHRRRAVNPHEQPHLLHERALDERRIWVSHNEAIE